MKQEYKDTIQGLADQHIGLVDLDEAIPFDIYDLFEQVTGYPYMVDNWLDELLILDIANYFEKLTKDS